jgi:hypothetical protein
VYGAIVICSVSPARDLEAEESLLHTVFDIKQQSGFDAQGS